MAFQARAVVCILYVLILTMTTAQKQMDDSMPDVLEGDPCSHPSSIKLPKSNKCLVLVKDARTWESAQSACEKAGGWLYRMPSALLYTRPRLMDCLSSFNGSDFTDLWLSGLSVWLPQFIWTNGTFMNKVTYCPPFRQLPKFMDAPITSDYLSVDYCVSTCHDQGARFTVLYNTGTSPKCNCFHSLDPKYRVKCPNPNYSYSDKSKLYIVHSEENSLIKVGSADTFSSTEIMCATVDSNTFTAREMKSDTCFTQRPFLCELGTAKECKAAKEELQCQGKECFFTCRNKCLKRVSFAYNWYAAKSYCSGLGGDLWMMENLDDMSIVAQHLEISSRYWIGASNYAWTFNASLQDKSDTTNFKLRCGHMIREVTSGSYSRTWTWSDASCTQEKSFLCEFDHKQFTSSERELNVSCPWPIIVPDGGGGTGGVTLYPPGPGVTQYKTVVHDSSFPIAAVIAGIIAGLILLTCLALTFAFCGRRHWRKVREHLTFIPYFSDTGHHVMGNSHEFENMSQVGRSHMSSVSEHGSQTGLVKGGYSSYANHTESNGMFSSKSLDRRQFESMAGQKLADSQHYLASANNSMDERGFGATYATMPSKQKEYMTLQAHMDIQDDAQLEAMRRSLRGKPEMTLVTDNADMNLTINHASSVNGTVVGGGGIAGNDYVIGSGSAGHAPAIVISGGSGAVSGNGIVIEESTLPSVASEGGVILTFPERVQEAHMYSTSPTIQVQHQQHHLNVM